MWLVLKLLIKKLITTNGFAGAAPLQANSIDKN